MADKNIIEKNGRIFVVDTLMGTGKSYWAIQYMQQHTEENLLYISPHKPDAQDRTEIKEDIRHIMNAVPRLQAPKIRGDNHKRIDDIEKLFKSSADIISTHALFAAYNKNCRAYIQQGEYTLILDETIDAVQPYELEHKDDIRFLKQNGYIRQEPDGKLTWVGSTDLDISYREIQNLTLNECLYEVNNAYFVWQFPPEIFKVFKKIFILTYNFDGSIMKPYFDINGIMYEKQSIQRAEKQNILVDYYKQDKSVFREKIHVYIGDDLNGKYQKSNCLSKNWFQSRSKTQLKPLQNDIYNYLRNKMHAKSQDIIWTTFKADKNKLKGKGYTKAFVPCTCKGLNEYRDRHVLVYAVNVYYHPTIEHYLNQHGAILNEEQYALNAMVQWVWRSAIRKGEEIYIYIPSPRMRKLFIDWLND